MEESRSPSRQAAIVEEREESMVSSTGDGNTILRTAHFLKPSMISIDGNFSNHPLYFPSFLPSSSTPETKKNWSLKLNFDGWRHPQRKWKEWVEKMVALHESTWKKVGIFEAVMNSLRKIRRDNDLILGIGEKWSPETNTFLFSWGEATITLEDMVAVGYSVLGSPVFLPLESEEMNEIERKLAEKRIGFCRTKARKAEHSSWISYFMENGCELEHEAFLSLWLSRFVFVHPTISDYVFCIAVRLARGIKVALAPALLASIYRDLTLLKEKIVTLSKLETYKNVDDILVLALRSPLQLFQVWAWERFPNLAPRPNVVEVGEPRLGRWHNVKSLRLGNVMLGLDSQGSFCWRPYSTADRPCKFYEEEEKWATINSDDMDEELQSFARCLIPCELVGIECMEQYSPHRVAMQFGMDQDLPGIVSRRKVSSKVAWNTYNKPAKGTKLFIPSRSFRPGVTLQYLKWWKQSMLGGKEASSSPKGCRTRRSSSKTKDIDCNATFTIPDFTPICQSLDSDDDEEYSRIIKELFCKRKRSQSIENGEVLLSSASNSKKSSENRHNGDPSGKEYAGSPIDRKRRLAKRYVTEGEANSPVRNVDNDHQEDNKVFLVRIPGLELEAQIDKLQKMVDELKATRFGSHSNQQARKSLPNKQ